ncbi:hypothetical protein KI387_038323, partial [Taxus chinensis]
AFAQISINGLSSEPFGIFQSIRQGCPLAPALYVMAAEGFGYLLAHAKVQGLVCGILLPDETNSQLLNGNF